MTDSFDEQEVLAIERPEPGLMGYYALRSLLAGPGFPVWLLLHFFRYRTLRYRFDSEGVSMSWGILFHREIHLTYARIQDIHLTSNAVERWLGLARVKIQTASGSAKAEMTIEGVSLYEAVRDYLYGKMRGARPGGHGAEPPSALAAPAPAAEQTESSELTAALQAVAEELRAVRLAIETREAERSEVADG